MLTIKDVARELNVHEITIFRHIKNGDIKGVKIGKSWRISQEELDRIKHNGI